MLLVALAPGLQPWRGRTGGQAHSELDASHRYRFQRAARGSVVRALEAEMAFYQERVRRNPTGGLDLAALARTYLKMARATGLTHWYLLAEQAAQRSLGNLPHNNAGAMLVLARVAEARHDFAGALRLARQVAGHEDALSLVVTVNLAMGKLDDASRAAEDLLGRIPTLGAYVLRALVRQAQGRDDDAIADFHRALAAEEPGETGSSAWARTMLGRLHFRRGRLALAEGLYREALRILPEYPLALVHRADLETRTGRYADAERHFRQVFDTSQNSPQVFDHVVLRGLARLRTLQGDEEGARALWDQAVARLRQDTSGGAFGHRRELARVLLERGHPGDVAEALALMQAEITVRRDAETLDILAWALSRSGRWHEAEQAIAEALRGGVRDAALFYRAGVIERALGNHAQAEAYFRSAAETDPAFDARARRAWGLEEWVGSGGVR
ncbi:MAG: tetratricopeptide repeat protein [Armatimonadetes bacterium]|nr:tetratricopeptide repeat protein [Armatimonadota bacterium]